MPDDAPVITATPLFDEIDIGRLLYLNGQLSSAPLSMNDETARFYLFCGTLVSRDQSVASIAGDSAATYASAGIYGSRGKERRSGSTANRIRGKRNWRRTSHRHAGSRTTTRQSHGNAPWGNPLRHR